MRQKLDYFKQELYIAKYQGRCMKLVCKKLGLKVGSVYRVFNTRWQEEYREFKKVMDHYWKGAK